MTPNVKNSFGATAMNRGRGAGELIIYNGAFGGTTGTNQWGGEVVVDSTGLVTAAPGYGIGNNAIPSGGFVLSGHDYGRDLISGIVVGDYVGYNASSLLVQVFSDRNSCLIGGKRVLSGQAYGELPAPAREGYLFAGWTDASGNPVAADTVFGGDGDVTLYAQWNPIVLTSIAIQSNPYKMNYNIGDALDTAGLTLSASYSDGSTQTVTNGFTCSPEKFTTSGTQDITVSYGGMTATFSVTVAVAELSGIRVKTNPTKTSYYVGDSLNTAGLTLTAKYSDGISKVISSGYTCSPTKLTKAGTQKIIVTYDGKTTSFNVTVTVPLNSISVKTKPTKLAYFTGDTLNTKGLTLTAKYSNGTTKTISSGFTCSPTKLSTAGTQKITVKYGSKATSFSVTVKALTVNSISLKTKPTKLAYFVGDTLNTAGLTLTAKYNNGATKTISSGFTCSPTKLSTAGTQKITVKYGGKTISFSVTVKAVVLSSIAVKTNPSKVSYFVGDTLNAAGLTLTATYNNGVKKTVTSGFTCSPTKLSTAGTQKITVTYGKKTTTFSVTVKAVVMTDIRIKTVPTKTNCFVGDTLNTAGLTLTAEYNNGTEKTVSSGFSCSPTKLSAAGTQTITVTYGGKTTKFNVRVTAVEVSGVKIKTLPTKKNYYVGDTLNTAGLVLTVVYNNGTQKDVTSGFTCNPTTLWKAGTKPITVTYGGKTASFNVNVTAVTLSSITVKTMPTKTAYFVGDTLNTEGLVLTATYNNGTTKTVTNGFTCSPTKLSTAGTQVITVTYSGKTTSFSVTVNAPVLYSIAVKTNPSKVSYFVGDTLNTAGLTLTAEYNNGTEKTVSSGFSCSPTKLSAAGTQTITVTYGGKTTKFNVRVTAVEVSGVKIKTLPTKKNYYVGDTLNTAGLVLTVVYNNGTQKDVTSGFTCNPTTLWKAGTKPITVTYGGKTASFNVNVTAVTLSRIATKTLPTKRAYFVGDTLNTAGLTLTATYNNGTTKTVTNGFTCSPTKLSTAGTQVITVTYQGKTATFNVTVKAVTVSSLWLKGIPTII